MSPPPDASAPALDVSAATAEPPDQARWFRDEVQPYNQQLKSYLRGCFPAVHDIEDVVQESYFRICKAKALYPIASTKAFLFKVARRVALDCARKTRNSPIRSLGDLATLQVVDERPGVRERVHSEEKARLLGEALAAIPRRQREVIVLTKIKGLTHREAAEQLGLSTKTVDEHVHQALRRLDRELRQRGIDGVFDK